MSKEGAFYVPKSNVPGKACANCIHIYVNHKAIICDQVGFDKKGDDRIAPEGMCKLWRDMGVAPDKSFLSKIFNFKKLIPRDEAA